MNNLDDLLHQNENELRQLVDAVNLTNSQISKLKVHLDKLIQETGYFKGKVDVLKELIKIREDNKNE